MIPKEFMTTDAANELATVILRLNDLHTRMVILQRQIDEHAKMIARMGRQAARERRSAEIHQRKVREEAPHSQH